MNDYQDRARLLKVMAHPMRLEILDIIRRSDECVCHLSAVLDKPQPDVSQQLAVLRNAGVITDRKDGNLVYYGLADGPASAQVDDILRAVAGESHVGQIAGPPREALESGHRSFPGCPCPKCEQGGDCAPCGNGS